jgi:hypothetical protein
MAKKQITLLPDGPQHQVAEFWRPVPSEPGVLASSLGRVLLAPRHAPLPNGGFRAYFPKPRYGSVARSKKGAKHEYMNIMLRGHCGQRQVPKKAHRLVCEAFHGAKPFEGAVVLHLDENALNNNPLNLRWGTQKENLNMPRFKEYCRGRTGSDNPKVKGMKLKKLYLEEKGEKL